MKTRECDLCNHTITKDTGVSFDVYDLCDKCVKVVRRAICRECRGTGKTSEVDHERTNSMATCGENRTQYRTVLCKKCV